MSLLKDNIPGPRKKTYSGPASPTVFQYLLTLQLQDTVKAFVPTVGDGDYIRSTTKARVFLPMSGTSISHPYIKHEWLVDPATSLAIL